MNGRVPPQYDTDDADPLVSAPVPTAPPPPKSYECAACLRRVAARVTRCPCCNQIATWQPSDEAPEVRRFRLPKPAPVASSFGRGLSHVPPGLVSAWMSGGVKPDVRVTLPGAEAAPVTRETAKARPRLLANVEYEKRDRFTTGIVPVDVAFGGKDDPGIPMGASYMLASPPNAGKSSIALRIAAAICQRYGVPVLYVTTPDEMGVDMVAEYARERGIWKEYPSAARFLQVVVAETVEESIALVDEVDAPFYVLDSTNGGLTTTNPTINSASKDAILLYVSKMHGHRCGRKLAKWRDAPLRTGLILAHGTKDGDMSGPQHARHNVDGTFLLEYFDPVTGWALEPRYRKEWVRLIQVKSRVAPPPPPDMILAFYTDQKRGPVPAQVSTE